MKIAGSKNEFQSAHHNSTAAILTQIPYSLEQYTHFILGNAEKLNFNRHLGWLVQSLGIEQETISEALLVDYIRYLLLVAEDVGLQKKKNEAVHRWLILGWVLKFLKSKYYIVMAKQALFFDWLFYDGDIRLYRIYEPVWLMIVNSLGKYREMSEEILEFLFVYSME